jgi:Spy/CpxP family protein refolding chaperone
MLLRTRLAVAGLALAFASAGAVVFAQQPQKTDPATGVQQPRRPGMARRAMRRRARLGAFRVLRQLNLTDEQKQQARSIRQKNRQSTEAQRKELRQLTQQWRQGTLTPEGLGRAKELRSQLAETRKVMRTQLDGILTAEQKAKLEEMLKARRANHGLSGRRNQTPN